MRTRGHLRFGWLLLLVSSVLISSVLSACSKNVIVIELDVGGLAPPDFNRVLIVVEGTNGTRAEGDYPISTLPQSLTVLPGSTMTNEVVIRVRAYSGNDFVAQRSIRTSFSGGTNRVLVRFDVQCRDVLCADDCMAGMCVGPGVLDGGVTDTGVRDASNDAQEIDAQVDLSVRDAGTDSVPSDVPTNDIIDSGPISYQGLVFNELDYDQPSNDTAEFIELCNGRGTAIQLDGLIVMAVNGSDGTIYASWTMLGSLGRGQFYVLHSSTITRPTGVLGQIIASQILQNGPDALIIYDDANRNVIDAVAYGPVPSNNVLNANVAGRIFNTVEGTRISVSDSSSSTRSLIRFPDGRDTNNAFDDWFETITLTPGLANVR